MIMVNSESMIFRLKVWNFFDGRISRKSLTSVKPFDTLFTNKVIVPCQRST